MKFEESASVELKSLLDKDSSSFFLFHYAVEFTVVFNRKGNDSNRIDFLHDEV